MSSKPRSPVEWVAHWIEMILAAGLLIAVVLNFGNVVGRYIFGVAMMAADETQIYLMAAMAFVGAAVVTVHHMHLRMDVLLQSFPPRVKAALKVVELLLIIGLGALVSWQSLSYVMQIFTLEVVSDNGHIPMWIPHASVTIGFSLMALAAALQLVQMILGRQYDMLGPQLEEEFEDESPDLLLTRQH
jgi:TRAP-type C4-dicarboxylate transport system permease small subunit